MIKSWIKSNGRDKNGTGKIKLNSPVKKERFDFQVCVAEHKLVGIGLRLPCGTHAQHFFWQAGQESSCSCQYKMINSVLLTLNFRWGAQILRIAHPSLSVKTERKAYFSGVMSEHIVVSQ